MLKSNKAMGRKIRGTTHFRLYAHPYGKAYVALSRYRKDVLVHAPLVFYIRVPLTVNHPDQPTGRTHIRCSANLLGSELHMSLSHQRALSR